MEKKVSFLPSIKKKVLKGEPLTDHESRIYMNDIQSRKARGEKIVGVELCADIMKDEESFEQFLFHSTDDEFRFAITQFRNYLSKEVFKGIMSVIVQKAPTRMNRLLNKGLF